MSKLEKRTRNQVVEEFQATEELCNYFLARKQNETKEGRESRLQLNRKRKRLTAELQTYQLKLF